jgi:ribosomal protein S18 acetylase RimI-like enzyme
VTIRRFAHLTARAPGRADEAFLAALYLASRPDLGALPVPRSVIEGIARHQQQLQLGEYAQRYPDAETWLVEEEGRPVARLVLDWSNDAVRVIDLSVAVTARRRGVARTVLMALQDDCHGQRAITLRVRRENLAARALYECLGFSVVRDDAIMIELDWRRTDV